MIKMEMKQRCFKCSKIRTDYLSKEQGEAKMKEDSSLKRKSIFVKGI